MILLFTKLINEPANVYQENLLRIKTVNSSGICYGGDMVFTTTKSPLKYGLYMIKVGTDELYIIDLETNNFIKIANIGMVIPDMFYGMQFINNRLYIRVSSKLYTCVLSSRILSQVISNTNLRITWRIISQGYYYRVDN
jgi:hypothetical protein